MPSGSKNASGLVGIPQKGALQTLGDKLHTLRGGLEPERQLSEARGESILARVI